MSQVSERRRYAATVALLLVGLGMLALANALDAYWPLFVTPLPYAAIPWMIARTQGGAGPITQSSPSS
jgi:hypothetical protein